MGTHLKSSLLCRLHQVAPALLICLCLFIFTYSQAQTLLTKVWDKRFGGSGDEWLSGSLHTNDGGYLLWGNSNSYQSGDVSQESIGGDDWWLVKMDACGNKMWDKRYNSGGYDYIG